MCTCQHNSHASINVDPSQSLHEPLSLIPSSHAFSPRALSYLIPLQLNSPIGYHSPTCATYLINPSHPLVPQPQSVSQSCNKITIRDEQMYTAAGLANHPPLFFQTSDILHAASSGPQHASSPAPVYTYNCVFPHSIFTTPFLSRISFFLSHHQNLTCCLALPLTVDTIFFSLFLLSVHLPHITALPSI